MSERRVPLELGPTIGKMRRDIDRLGRRTRSETDDLAQLEYAFGDVSVPFTAAVTLTSLNVDQFVIDSDVIRTSFKIHVRNANGAPRMFSASILIDGVAVETFNLTTEDGNRVGVREGWRLDGSLAEGTHSFGLRVAPIDAGDFTVVIDATHQAVLTVETASA